eukprot:639920-Rhodomonas_salina.3
MPPAQPSLMDGVITVAARYDDTNYDVKQTARPRPLAAREAGRWRPACALTRSSSSRRCRRAPSPRSICASC